MNIDTKVVKWHYCPMCENRYKCPGYPNCDAPTTWHCTPCWSLRTGGRE